MLLSALPLTCCEQLGAIPVRRLFDGGNCQRQVLLQRRQQRLQLGHQVSRAEEFQA